MSAEHEYVQTFNPERECFPVRANWESVRLVAKNFAQLTLVVTEVLEQRADFIPPLELLFEALRQALCETINVDPGIVDLSFSIPEDDPYEMGNASKNGGRWVINLRRLESAYPKNGERTDLDELMEKLALWMFVIIHEMYHVRQGIYVSGYYDESGEAAEADNKAIDEDLPFCPEYDDDLGERSADAFGIRGLLEITRVLRETRRDLPRSEVQMRRILNYLIAACAGIEASECRSLKRRSRKHAWISGVYSPRLKGVD